MTSIQLLKGFTGIDSEFLVRVEQRTDKQKEMKSHRGIHRPFLLAALIALLLMLVGCGIVYVLHLQDLKIGEQTVPQTQYDDSSNQIGETEVHLDVLSIQGIKGTPNYLANQEWLAFTNSYTHTGGGYWESEPEYWAYSVQNQEMVDKLDEICAKYGLKIIGKPWHEHIDCNPFLTLLGIDSLLKPNADATLSIPAGRFFPGGSFTIYGTLKLAETDNLFTYHCVKKDVFYDVFGYVDGDSVLERNYTTTDGLPLLLLESNQSGMILADREDCFFTLSVDLTGDATLEQLAECFDFTIHTDPPDASAADAREQASLEEMNSRQGDPNKLRRSTYGEYVADLIQGDEMWRSIDPEYTPPSKAYAFYDVDGNGTEELLIFYNGYIGNIVGMKNGITDDGKSYHMYLCEDNVLVDFDSEPNGLGEYRYHIFRFANDGDPVFSNPKEQSIVRLKKCADGTWWRTSSTEHYAEFDTEISEAEAMEILNSYKPVDLETRPLTQFEDP
ncbi:MAG: hypothetical protein PUK18_06700 [Firmicutes bacterium]|nr:hypothetical protein [Bacillota bacterium]MDY6161082.1 hypothetical protein [Candidatus Faecousia sp.]